MKVVVNARNGARDFECEPGEKILHAGLRSGVELPYECATGTCGPCKARLLSCGGAPLTHSDRGLLPWEHLGPPPPRTSRPETETAACT